jgi:hypothetical protein
VDFKEKESHQKMYIGKHTRGIDEARERERERKRN